MDDMHLSKQSDSYSGIHELLRQILETNQFYDPKKLTKT